MFEATECCCWWWGAGHRENSNGKRHNVLKWKGQKLTFSFIFLGLILLALAASLLFGLCSTTVSCSFSYQQHPVTSNNRAMVESTMDYCLKRYEMGLWGQKACPLLKSLGRFTFKHVLVIGPRVYRISVVYGLLLLLGFFFYVCVL